VIVGNKLLLNFAGAGTQQLAGPNSRRVGLIVSTPSASVIFINIGDAVDPTTGLRMNSGAYPPFQLVFDAPNDWITQAITINSQGACLVFAVELVDRQP